MVRYTAFGVNTDTALMQIEKDASSQLLAGDDVGGRKS